MNNDRHFGSNSVDIVDSDDDDLSDSLTPTDGYFSQSSQVPQQVLVPDEEPEGSRSKAQEAAHESSTSSQRQYHAITPPASSPVLTRSTIYTPSSPSRSSRSLSDSNEDPLLPADLHEDPPPLYETAIASGRQSQQQHTSPSETSPLSPGNSTNYNTMGRPNDFPVPFRDDPGAPQSMADSPDDMYNDEEAGIRRNGRGRWLDRSTTGGRFRRFVLTMVGVMFLILVLLALLGPWRIDSDGNIHGGHQKPVFEADPPSTTPHPITTPSPTSTPSPNLPTPTSTPTSSHLPTPDPDPVPKPEPGVPAAPGARNREIRIIDEYHSISGKYPLRDLLYVRTITGSITIDVVIPKDWNDSSEPSVLDIGAQSGSITLKFVDERGYPIGRDGYLPAVMESASGFDKEAHAVRPLNSYVSTRSGAISGTFLHGNNTTYSAVSGSISGTFHPLTFSTSHLSTTTVSGSTTLTVTDPLRYHSHEAGPESEIATNSGREMLSDLYAHHTSQNSGSLTLSYPPSWTGRLHILRLGSGSITADGKGLTITQYTSHHVIGNRGDGAGKVQIDQMGSGSTTFKCKEDGWFNWKLGILSILENVGLKAKHPLAKWND